MKFIAEPKYVGKEIEVKKVTSSSGNKNAIELILELTQKFDNFVKDQDKRWAEQEKFNKEQRKFNNMIIKRLDNIVEKNNLKE